MQGLRDLEHAVNELGFVGAHLYPHWFGLAPDHARYYPYYAKCCELGIPIMMQVGHNLVYSRQRRLPSVGRPITLDQVAIDFPELVIVCGHVGYPWTEEMIAVATKHPNVYIDTSAYTVRRYPAALVDYLRAHGAAKVLFGSNWPMIAPRKALEGLAELELPPEVETAFLAGNAARVFRLAGLS
jgi:predicted TIM-barrel fold metal-dependent hydrolase